MALYKSNLLAQASGRLDGSIFSHNRAGRYIRNGSIPVNPNSTDQQRARADFGSASIRWRDVLTQAQRDAWDAIAHTITAQNAFGDPIELTGQQAYIRAASVALLVGLSTPDDAPADFGDTPLSPVELTSATYNDATPLTLIELAIDTTDPWANSNDGRLIVQQSHARSPASNFHRSPFVFVGDQQGDGDIPPPNATISHSGGSVVGARYFFRVRAYINGRLSQPQVVNGIMEAA